MKVGLLLASSETLGELHHFCFLVSLPVPPISRGSCKMQRENVIEV